MDRAARDDAIIRDLLERIDDSAEINQRRLAKELGIALGMTNAYVKRCIRKGWVKVNQVPARRYRYYLTPKGFAEKSRLTARFLSDSLTYFRRARQSFDDLYRKLEARGVRRIVLCGADELTEIAVLCSAAHRVEVVGVLAADGRDHAIAGIAAVDPAAPPEAELWVIAGMMGAPALHARATAIAGADRVATPSILKSILRRQA